MSSNPGDRHNAAETSIPPMLNTPMTWLGSIGAKKDGHPVPESNLVSEENSGRSPTACTTASVDAQRV